MVIFELFLFGETPAFEAYESYERYAHAAKEHKGG